MTALPSVAEKGYLDVRLTVSSPGGHSSIPPVHTVESFVLNLFVATLTLMFIQSIGLLATMIVALEETPIPVKLSRGLGC